jgi:hypothetical protein
MKRVTSAAEKYAPKNNNDFNPVLRKNVMHF